MFAYSTKKSYISINKEPPIFILDISNYVYSDYNIVVISPSTFIPVLFEVIFPPIVIASYSEVILPTIFIALLLDVIFPIIFMAVVLDVISPRT